MTRLNRSVCLTLVAVAFWCSCRGMVVADEIAAVTSRAESYVAAFNRRDVDACAEHWSEDAEYVLSESGARLQGRQAIRAELERLLKTEESFELSLADQRLRQVSADVVLEEGTAMVVSARHGLERASYVVVHVQRDGQWYRDSVRETTWAAPIVSSSPLYELSWLVGHWRAENDQGSFDIHGQWMHDKRFISRSFQVRGNDGYRLDGTQIVGWDPSAGVIRSWSFDSEGGFERAIWTQEGQQWLVKVNAVLPDGSVGSEQRRVTHEGNGRMSTEVIEQQVDGQLLPGSEKVTFIRQSENE